MNKKFKDSTSTIQTVFASVYFQYAANTKTIRKNLTEDNFKAAVITLINYTSLTFEIENKKTKKKRKRMGGCLWED